MREYKFRTWYAEKQEMEYDTGHYSIDGVVTQYTGLKDNRGVEIYEGDIMKIADKVYYVDDVEFGPAFMERPDCGDPFINFLSRNPFTDVYTPMYDVFEVIGNIYETPELVG